MATPYSVDLRKRVLAECDKGILKKYEIATMFKVDLKTIYNWIRAKNKTGTIEPKTGYQKGHSHKITDIETFKTFISNNPNSSLKDLSKKWGNISSSTIRNQLHRIGFTVKKNNGATKSEMNKKELNI